MKCTAARERIHTWLDTAAAASLPLDLKGHVGECQTCRHFIRQWNSVEIDLQALHSLEAAEPLYSPSMASAVRARVSGSRPGWSIDLAPLRGMLAAGACAAAIVLLSVLIWTRVISDHGRDSLATIAAPASGPQLGTPGGR